MAIFDDDVVHVHGLEFGEAFWERDQVDRVVGAVELEELRFGGIPVATPPEFAESLLEFGVGLDHLVGREIDQDSGPSPWRGGGAGMGRVLVLERLACWVRD